LETEMDSIQEGITDRGRVIEDAKSTLERFLNMFRNKEKQIGEALLRGLQKHWKDTEELGPCPSCDDGILRIIRSQKTGKRFVGCSNHREGKCNQTFPLPQKGTITPLDEACPYCGYRMIKVISGRRIWTTCINWSKCPGRQEELKALDERRNQRRNDTIGNDTS
jgi:DNA topoisomerase-1